MNMVSLKKNEKRCILTSPYLPLISFSNFSFRQKFDPNYVNEVYQLATSIPYPLLTPLISSVEPKDVSDDATEPVETVMSTNASTVFSYLVFHFSSRGTTKQMEGERNVGH